MGDVDIAHGLNRWAVGHHDQRTGAKVFSQNESVIKPAWFQPASWSLLPSGIEPGSFVAVAQPVNTQSSAKTMICELIIYMMLSGLFSFWSDSQATVRKPTR